MSVLCVSTIKEDLKNKLVNLDSTILFKERDQITEEDLQEVEVVIGNLPVSLLQKAPKLKWVQLNSAGADSYSVLDDSVTITNASGAYGEAMSEHMVGCTLMVVKDLAKYIEQQKERRWENIGKVRRMKDLKVLSIGMGDIGSEYAKRMHALGATVYGVRRTIHDQPDYIDDLYTLDTFEEILPKCDVVAMSLPGTEETKNFMNEQRLAMMKKDSVLINVGRGSAIDEDALLKFVRNGKFAGVCLDVTAHEPLPKNNPLWTTDRIYITPHISGGYNVEETYLKVAEIIYSNFKHYLNKEPLEHIVNKKLGY